MSETRVARKYNDNRSVTLKDGGKTTVYFPPLPFKNDATCVLSLYR